MQIRNYLNDKPKITYLTLIQYKKNKELITQPILFWTYNYCHELRKVFHLILYFLCTFNSNAICEQSLAKEDSVAINKAHNVNSSMMLERKQRHTTISSNTRMSKRCLLQILDHFYIRQIKIYETSLFSRSTKRKCNKSKK